jgi:thymidine kinase
VLIQEQEGKSNMAKLYFRYGAMNCGKTTSLLQVAHNYEERDQTIILIKPSIDLKGGSSIVSRLNISREVDTLIAPDESIIEKIKGSFDKINCVLADESQFFTEKQIDELFVISKI